MAENQKKKKHAYVRPETGSAANFTMIWVVKAYVFLMFALYPLYYQDKYYNMGQAKWEFFRLISSIFGVLCLIILIWYLGCFIAAEKFVPMIKEFASKLNLTDCFVLAYFVITTISTIATPYKENVIFGYEGWYMGYVAQVGFVLIYFLVSRFWRWDSIHLFIFLMTAFIVFFFGVIMKFHIDPMEMYVDLDEQYVENFISTLGQATWYSSYMCILYPLGVIAYWRSEKLWQKIAFGIFTVMSFMTVVTQNSDSAYMAIMGVFFLLFWISFESNTSFLRFLEVMIMALGAFKFMGLMQKTFAEHMVWIDRLSIFMSQSTFTLVLLIVVVALYLFMRFWVFKKTEFQISSVKMLRCIALVLVIAGIVGGIIYIYLNTTGRLPENLASDNNYLFFNDRWGNSRGLSWKCAVGTFVQENLWLKLFGAGPDSFAESVYTYFATELNERWGEGTTLTCAHNEWLNAVINVGILGLIAYLGSFISAFRDCMKKAKEYPELFGVAISIVAYILHNFFCYQQIICTPTIFILMGMAQSVIRFGYADETQE